MKGLWEDASRAQRFIALGIVFVLLILIYLLFSGNTLPQAKAADSYIGELSKGNFSNAYKKLCSVQKNQTNEKTFADSQINALNAARTQYGEFKSHRPLTVNKASKDQATVRERLTYERAKVDVLLDMSREKGHWLFCGQASQQPST